MAETLVENQVCNTCGVEIRPNAQFCYHCGAAVEEDLSAENPNLTTKLSPESVQKPDLSEVEEENNLVEEPEEKKGNRRKRAAKIKVKSVNNGNEETKLKTAASLRNKTKRLEPKKVEIIWEEHENAPNLWFIGVAVLLLLFTLVIYFIAQALR